MSDFLDKGTDDIAKVLQWKSPDPSGTVRQGYVCVRVCGGGGCFTFKRIFFPALTVSCNVDKKDIKWHFCYHTLLCLAFFCKAFGQ